MYPLIAVIFFKLFHSKLEVRVIPLIIKQEGICHAGTKASKVVFLGSSGRLLTTGFSRHSDRQYAIWSQHDLNVPLTCETIDSSSGVVFPYYDNDTNMVYLAGKVNEHTISYIY